MVYLLNFFLRPQILECIQNFMNNPINFDHCSILKILSIIFELKIKGLYLRNPYHTTYKHDNVLNSEIQSMINIYLFINWTFKNILKIFYYI